MHENGYLTTPSAGVGFLHGHLEFMESRLDQDYPFLHFFGVLFSFNGGMARNCMEWINKNEEPIYE